MKNGTYCYLWVAGIILTGHNAFSVLDTLKAKLGEILPYGPEEGDKS